MQLLLQDIRYALRIFRKSPGLTAVILLSLAIGIGANTAIFSVADALLLRPLPYPDPNRLAILWLRSPGINIPQDWPSPGQYLDIVQQNHVFEETAIAIGSTWTLTGRDQPQRIEGIQTSSSLFHVLGARPLYGGLLLPEDDKPGKPPVAILTYGLWKRLFGGDPQIVGKAITLTGNQFTVGGVLRPDFLLNNEIMPTVASIERIEILLPLKLPADAQTKLRGSENFNILARVKLGVSMQQAQADIDVIARRIREQDKRDPTFTISVVPLQEQVVGDVKRALVVLLGSVALVLLIACFNVANLLLSRATGRQKEVAIRTALGAHWSRMVRQLLTESVLLGLAGGALGLAVAAWTLGIVRTINPGNIPRLDAIHINGAVLAFTFGVSILTGIIFGIAPAFRVVNVNLNSTLKAGGRSSQSAGGFNSSRHRLRSLLVVAEVAISLMLLIGAGLLIRSFARLTAVNPGFTTERIISMRMEVSGPRYNSAEKYAQFQRDLADRIGRLPGVKARGVVSTLPLTTGVGWGGMQVEGYTPPPNEPELQVDQRVASADYFRAMEIPLLAGRLFDEHDTPAAPPVVMIDHKMAQRFWPHDNPVGKRLRRGTQAPWMTIVGVVGTVKQYGLDVDGRMVVYSSIGQRPGGGRYLVARTTSSDPAALAGAMTREVHAVDPNVPVYEIRTMQDRLHQSLARPRFSMTMLVAFAAFALLLAAVGIYGVISYLVTQGTHDIGVRIALGAQPRNIRSMVVRQGLELTALGVAAGLVGAFLLTRVMSSLLFGVSATDAATFVAVAVFLAAVALLASYIPALRATRVDPMIALRDE